MAVGGTEVLDVPSSLPAVKEAVAVKATGGSWTEAPPDVCAIVDIASKPNVEAPQPQAAGTVEVAQTAAAPLVSELPSVPLALSNAMPTVDPSTAQLPDETVPPAAVAAPAATPAAAPATAAVAVASPRPTLSGGGKSFKSRALSFARSRQRAAQEVLMKSLNPEVLSSPSTTKKDLSELAVRRKQGR